MIGFHPDSMMLLISFQMPQAMTGRQCKISPFNYSKDFLHDEIIHNSKM